MNAGWMVFPLSSIVLLFWGWSARAEVVVQTPSGHVVLGKPAPQPKAAITVQLGRLGVQFLSNAPERGTPPPAPVQRLQEPPIVSTPAPVQRPVPSPVVPLFPEPRPTPVVRPQPAAPTAMTIAEFVAVFRPIPGTHKVRLIHPCTGTPVEVCFTLPEGNLKKVNVSKREIEFDFGKREVEIRFKCNGKVEVD